MWAKLYGCMLRNFNFFPYTFYTSIHFLPYYSYNESNHETPKCSRLIGSGPKRRLYTYKVSLYDISMTKRMHTLTNPRSLLQTSCLSVLAASMYVVSFTHHCFITLIILGASSDYYYIELINGTIKVLPCS